MKYLFLTLFILTGCGDVTVGYKAIEKEAEENAYKRVKKEQEFEQDCKALATFSKTTVALVNGADGMCLLHRKSKHPLDFNRTDVRGALKLIYLMELVK